MVRLAVMPNQAIVSGWKGTIDFYYYMGIPVARRWPRPPSQRRSPAVESTWPIFTAAVHAWPTLSVEVQDVYRKMASGSALTGRDLFIRSYIKGIYRYSKGEDVLPACCAYGSANQLNIPSGIDTKVQLDTELFDIGGNFDPVLHRFICPREGRYLVIGHIFWLPTVINKYFDARIALNGAILRLHRELSTSLTYFSVTAAVLLDCDRYDYIELFARHNDGVGTSDIYCLNSAIYTRLEITLIQ